MDALTGNVKFDKHMKINLSGNADNKSGWRTIQDDNQLNGVGSKKDNIDMAQNRVLILPNRPKF